MKCKFTMLTALAGWYLMVPPTVVGLRGETAITTAPVSHWKVLRVYDAAYACEQEMLRKQAQDHNAAESAIECIATNDPRLGN